MKFVTILLIALFTTINAQNFQSVFTGSQINGAAASGWFYFEKSGENWKSRLYYLDTLTFKVASGTYSNATAYTYTFSAAEKAAGYLIYSLGADLDGDNFTEFYIMSQYGSSTDYRQGFKIFSIVTGATIFERVAPNMTYSYPTLDDLDDDGVLDCYFYKYSYPYTGTYSYEVYSTGISGLQTPGIPASFTLNQNFPNPFNPSTVIRFTLTQAAEVTVKIYSVTGKLVRTLSAGSKDAGTHEITWDAKDDHGVSLPSGIYTYSMGTGLQQESKKMVLIR